MQRTLVLAVGAFLCVPMLLASGTRQGATDSPLFTVETLSAGCARGDSKREISVQGTSLIVTAELLAPNPCYEISGVVRTEGDRIEVRFTPVRRAGMCIQCIGQIAGRVTILDLPVGTYALTIQTPERTTHTTIEIQG